MQMINTVCTCSVVLEATSFTRGIDKSFVSSMRG
jgi:hypothetical protein